MDSTTRLRLFRQRIAVRGLFWRQYLDWAMRNVPYYMHNVLICFWALFFLLVATSARRALLHNLKLILPGSSAVVNHLRALVTFWGFSWTITDAAYYRATRTTFDYDLSEADHIDELVAAPGAILLTAHMGSYDLGAALFAQKFQRELRIVRAPEPDPETADHLDASLRESGAGAVKVDYNSSTLLSFDLLNALRQGEIVSIQGDRAVGDIAQSPAQLFGHTVLLPNGPFILSLISGVSIFPLFVVRSGFRRYKIITSTPIQCVRSSGSREEQIATALQQWCCVLEQTINRYRSQWYAFAPMQTTAPS